MRSTVSGETVGARSLSHASLDERAPAFQRRGAGLADGADAVLGADREQILCDAMAFLSTTAVLARMRQPENRGIVKRTRRLVAILPHPARGARGSCKS